MLFLSFTSFLGSICWTLSVCVCVRFILFSISFHFVFFLGCSFFIFSLAVLFLLPHSFWSSIYFTLYRKHTIQHTIEKSVQSKVFFLFITLTRWKNVEKMRFAPLSSLLFVIRKKVSIVHTRTTHILPYVKKNKSKLYACVYIYLNIRTFFYFSVYKFNVWPPPPHCLLLLLSFCSSTAQSFD